MNFINTIPNRLYKTNVRLSDYSSMRTGGIADLVFYPESEEDLFLILKVLKAEGQNFKIFGCMGNVLFPDDGMRTPLIFTSKLNFKELYKENNIIYAQSGVSLTGLSLFAGTNSLSGLEFAYGIPASVGGAVYMNAGAYGGEIKDVVKKVNCVDVNTLKIKYFENEENEFSYRKSTFMNDNYFIIGAYFYLYSGIKEDILAKSNDFMKQRRLKQPLEYPSCGSAFKRPEGYFAGKLIEDCGLKGFGIGGAYISVKHAGFIINKGGATTNDVLSLIKHVQKMCMEKFGVLLEPEIRIIKD